MVNTLSLNSSIEAAFLPVVRHHPIHTCNPVLCQISTLFPFFLLNFQSKKLENQQKFMKWSWKDQLIPFTHTINASKGIIAIFLLLAEFIAIWGWWVGSNINYTYHRWRHRRWSKMSPETSMWAHSLTDKTYWPLIGSSSLFSVNSTPQTLLLFIWTPWYDTASFCIHIREWSSGWHIRTMYIYQLCDTLSLNVVSYA